MNNLVLEVVKDSLEAIGVPEATLQKVPTLVRRAIVDLQREDILPPRILDFKAENVKREQLDANNELLYHYIEAPKDFRKLYELHVFDKRSPYQQVQHEEYLENISKANKHIKIFSVTFVNNDTIDKSRVIIPIYPFPEPTTAIRLKYHIDGTENSLNYLDETYHTVIINKVESYLGLRAPQLVDEESVDMARQWRNAKGKNIINSTMIKTKPNRLFGK
jgi:hypothetical protein